MTVNGEVIAGLLATMVALAVPLLLAALGEVVVERAGVINVGIEGMMLAGAFSGYLGSYFFKSEWIGALCAIAAGVLLALLFGLLVLLFVADQVVVGTAINLLSLGLTGVFYFAFRNAHPMQQLVSAFAPISIPVLSRIPLVGQAFFNQNAIGYAAFILAPLTWFFLSRMRIGLGLRALGEHPLAAEGAGINVLRVRAAALTFGGAAAGLAGAFGSIGYTIGFAPGMTGGKGFIALAVVIVGQWSPLMSIVAALCFSLASALQFLFQSAATSIPYQVFRSLPYVLTLLALLFRAGRVRAPAGLAQPYVRS